MKYITQSNRIICFLILVVTLTLFQINSKAQKVTFGVISDVHKGLQIDAEKRLQVFIDAANKQGVDFIVQLGDLTHGNSEDIKVMTDVWNKYQGLGYHVLGNHDMDLTTKEEVIEQQSMPGKYYSFDAMGFHFVVLDCNYILKDGEYKDYAHSNYYIDKQHRDLINDHQLQWLAKDLEATDKPAIIFSHQGIGELWETSGVPNKQQIRDVINKANRNQKAVIACFSGHHHVDYVEKMDDVYYFLINSASYYYCDKPNYSNKHLAEYKDPLFAFVTFDYSNRTITIEGVESVFLPPDPSKENNAEAEKISASILSRSFKF